jgi:hypothetical protein
MKIKITILFLILAFGANAQAWWFAVPQDEGTLPISLWRLDETSGTNVADAIGSNDGTNNGATINQPSVSKAYNFDGTNDRIVVQDAASLSFADAMSVSAWVNINGSITGAEYILIKADDLGSATDKLEYRITVNSINQLNFSLSDDGLWNNAVSIGTTTAMTPGTWHHVVCVYNGTSMIMYQDNVQIGIGTDFTGNIYNGTADMYMGARWDDSESIYNFFFDGEIDQLSIFDEAITTDDIAELYKDGAGVYYDTWTTSLQTKGISVWEFDETSGTTVLDQISENDGILNGATINVPGVVSDLLKSYLFDGINDNIDLGDLTHTDDISISCWVKNTSNDGYIIGHYDYGSDDRSWVLFINSSNKFQVSLSTNGILSASTGKIYTTASTYTNDVWYHVVFTFSDNILKIYIDGAEDTPYTKTFDATFSTIHPSSANTTIGSVLNNGSPSLYYDGTIDQVRFYNVAITSEDVTALYKNGRGN